MEDLQTSVLSIPKISPPPRFGTSQGKNWGAYQDYQENPLPHLELLMEDLGTLVVNLPRISLQKWNFSWRTVHWTGVWRLIVVSPADNVSFVCSCSYCFQWFPPHVLFRLLSRWHRKNQTILLRNT